MSEYKTVNRGTLKRLAGNGLLEARLEHSYDDMDGSKSSDQWMRVHLSIDQYDTLPECLNFEDWYFKTKSGHAYMVDGKIRLVIHPNLFYEVRRAV